jgi:hypothetical protein
MSPCDYFTDYHVSGEGQTLDAPGPHHKDTQFAKISYEVIWIGLRSELGLVSRVWGDLSVTGNGDLPLTTQRRIESIAF